MPSLLAAARRTLVALAAQAPVVVTWRALGPDLRGLAAGGAAARTPEAAVLALCEIAVLTTLAWLAASAIAVCLTAEPHLPAPRVTLGAPAWWRRLLLVACGGVLAGTLAPAGATPGSLTPLPQHAAERSAPQAPAAAPAAHARVHTVRVGDCLWHLAETRLGVEAGRADDPDTAAVAAYVARLWAANRDVVGADPDLLQPGQHLRLPDPGPHGATTSREKP